MNNKTMYMNHSYVMGIDNSIFDLQNDGFIIEKDGNNFMVSFPRENSHIWENFISDHLQLGYWNEYIQNDEVVFLFQLEKGIKRYEVYLFDNDEVLSLCECKFESLYSMLKGNHFYSRYI